MAKAVVRGILARIAQKDAGSCAEDAPRDVAKEPTNPLNKGYALNHILKDPDKCSGTLPQLRGGGGFRV